MTVVPLEVTVYGLEVGRNGQEVASSDGAPLPAGAPLPGVKVLVKVPARPLPPYRPTAVGVEDVVVLGVVGREAGLPRLLGARRQRVVAPLLRRRPAVPLGVPEAATHMA